MTNAQNPILAAARRAALAAIILRAIIPAGYMPGDLRAGEFMVLCPAGLSAEFLHAVGIHHHDHGETVVDADRICPIGSALSPDFVSGDPPVSNTLESSIRLVPAPETGRPGIELARAYHSRAPPAV